LEQINFHKLLEDTYDHLWNGRSRLALSNAKKIFKHFPDNSEASVVLAWALLENGYPIKALEYADLALQLNGSSTKGKMIRAQILLRLNILDGAAEDFQASIKNQKNFLGNSYVEYARLEAGKGNLQKALKLIDLALFINPGIKEEAGAIKKLLISAMEIKTNKKNLDKKNLQNYFNKTAAALKNKDIWFVNIIAENILKNKSLKEFHTDAELIKLEGLFRSFQFKPAIKKAEELKSRLGNNKQFKKIYEKILKKKKAQETIAEELEKEFNEFKSPFPIRQDKDLTEKKQKRRTDAVFFKNNKVDVFSLKIFNQTEEEVTGKRRYYEQLSETNLQKVGLEIIFDNPFFNKSENDYKAKAIWYLNNFAVYKKNFLLHVPKDWDTVIFTQTAEAKWLRGQAKAEIYIENFKVCEKWFVIDSQSILYKSEKKENGLKLSTSSDNEVTENKETQAELPPARPLEELLRELNGYIGLHNIKEAIYEFINYLKFQQERERKGLSGGRKFSINAVFEGNPGTGKTTIARLLGEIFRAMKIVEKGHVVEVDRSALVGQYVGETAQKTDKLIEEAMGGILFIDEAYTLVKKGGSGQDFGQEAIDILLKRMEDKKGEFVVIVAGYPKEMKAFIESNPGLKSRFNHTFTFEDYTPDELLEIFTNTVSKEDYQINEDAKEELKKEFIRLYRKRDATFGNARLVIQIFEKLKIQLSKRVAKLKEEERTKELLSTFILEDIHHTLYLKENTDVQLPVDEEALSEALGELNNLYGLQSIKNEVADLVKLVKYFIQQGENVRNKFSDHILFLGNPGTGKTTVARIISNIYAALGILPNGQLIEVDRSGLVGSYVGETAQKTTAVINSAMGGTLFIDEAYALTSSGSSNDFGKEAIDTLLKRMEDDRGKFIVIAAGYTNEMKNFIASNPGMKSRFTKTFLFEDYTPDELMKIAKFSIANLNLELTPETEEALKIHFAVLYSKRDKHFGNARIVRNLLEKIKKKHLLRIAEEEDETTKNKIVLADVEDFIETKNIAKKFKPKKKDFLKILLADLRNLVGQNSVKEKIDKQIKSLQVSKLRAERGLKQVGKNLNALFIANRGTGKSKIAELLGKIYKELNYLKNGHLVEVKGRDLLAANEEQAYKKVEYLIDKAMDGILVIDNPTPLYEQENLAEIIFENLSLFAEKYFGKLVIIIAGTEEEIAKLNEINITTGLKFNETFFFDDYSPRELLDISVHLAADNNYILDEGALQELMDLYLCAQKSNYQKYQNIHLAEHVLLKAISNQEERISSLYDLSDEALSTIIYEDIAPVKIDDL